MPDTPQPDTPKPAPRRKCPECGKHEAVRIVYGLPSFEPRPPGAARDYVLGGCVIHGDSPGWACQACGAHFGRASTG